MSILRGLWPFRSKQKSAIAISMTVAQGICFLDFSGRWSQDKASQNEAHRCLKRLKESDWNKLLVNLSGLEPRDRDIFGTDFIAFLVLLVKEANCHAEKKRILPRWMIRSRSNRQFKVISLSRLDTIFAGHLQIIEDITAPIIFHWP